MTTYVVKLGPMRKKILRDGLFIAKGIKAVKGRDQLDHGRKSMGKWRERE